MLLYCSLTGEDVSLGNLSCHPKGHIFILINNATVLMRQCPPARQKDLQHRPAQRCCLLFITKAIYLLSVRNVHVYIWVTSGVGAGSCPLVTLLILDIMSSVTTINNRTDDKGPQYAHTVWKCSHWYHWYHSGLYAVLHCCIYSVHTVTRLCFM